MDNNSLLKKSAKSHFLASGTIIDQYIIERELARGGFSSVYLARHVSNQTPVAIKEYLPKKLSKRLNNKKVKSSHPQNKTLFLKGKTLFFEEAKALAKLNHPNIINPINFFRANNTGYMVMPYEKGVRLDKLFKKNQPALTVTEFSKLFTALLSGIQSLHQNNILHLDVKPNNIIIRPDFVPLLLDFGAMQNYPSKNKEQRTMIITQGFSPIEQYTRMGYIGPWSDIYAIGCSMYFCLTGEKPVSALKRITHDPITPAVKAFKNQYPYHLLKAVDWAMHPKPMKRPRSIKSLQNYLRYHH